MKNAWRSAGGILALVLVAGVLFYLWNLGSLFVDQAHHVYYPERKWAATPSSQGVVYEDVTFRASDGVTLSGWFVPSGGEGAVTVLMCHGNAGNISHRMHEIRVVHELGLDAFIFDYRGYGKSADVSPTEEGTYRDAEAAWRYLVEERGIPPERIVVSGRSLGAAIAAYLAERHSPRALVIESGFTSLPEIGQELYPVFPVRWLLLFRYDTLSRLSRIRCPVLVIHSRADEIIPFHHGKELFEAANKPKRFLEIQGSHNGGYRQSEKLYKEALRDFLFDKSIRG